MLMYTTNINFREFSLQSNGDQLNTYIMLNVLNNIPMIIEYYYL